MEALFSGHDLAMLLCVFAGLWLAWGNTSASITVFFIPSYLVHYLFHMLRCVLDHLLFLLFLKPKCFKQLKNDVLSSGKGVHSEYQILAACHIFP